MRRCRSGRIPSDVMVWSKQDFKQKGDGLVVSFDLRFSVFSDAFLLFIRYPK